MSVRLFDHDLYHMVRRGWFPKTDFPALEEMRNRLDALIDVRDEKQAVARGLHERFKAEDAAAQEALNRAYSDGREPEAVEVTPEDERKSLLRDAEAHATAAAVAVVTYAREAVMRLRGGEGFPEGWGNPVVRAQSLQAPPEGEAAKALATIAQRERELRQQIAEARRLIEDAGYRLRAFVPLKHWLARNGNAAPNMILRGDDLTVPAAYTDGTKPVHLHVPGWEPDVDGGDTWEDTSDPEAIEIERSRQ